MIVNVVSSWAIFHLSHCRRLQPLSPSLITKDWVFVAQLIFILA